MNLDEVSFDGLPHFDGYGPGFFRVGGSVVEGAVLVEARDVKPWGGLDDTAALLALRDRVDFVLLGMGPEIAHPPGALRMAMDEAGIGLEVMSSPAACRTYNVLLGEGRRVAAAVLPVEAPEETA